MLKRILVALDSRESCTALFESALNLAQAMDAELMLLSVLTIDEYSRLAPSEMYGVAYSPMGISDSGLWEDYQERYQQRESSGLTLLRRLTAQATEAGVTTQFDQAFGDPGRVICNSAEAWNADIVLVGSHGRKGLSELLLGSVSSYVMHRAPCSVLVVRKPWVGEPGAEVDDAQTADAQTAGVAAE